MVVEYCSNSQIMGQMLLIGTTNPGKQVEIAAILEPLHVPLVTPSEIGLEIQIEETGETYAENARLKAGRYAQASGLWAISDDTGLEVELLDGAPGPRSARFAPTAADRREKLVGQLVGYPRPWKALFRAVVAIADPHSLVGEAEGKCHGEILPEPRGTGGFGYDPIFWIPTLGKTMAELDMLEKNAVSHRAQAIHAILPALRMAIEL
jgi:XTP/dITP diphosphohydrolase